MWRYAALYSNGKNPGVCIHWTGLLDWTTGLTFELTFELFFLSMINIAVVLLAKVNLGVVGK